MYFYKNDKTIGLIFNLSIFFAIKKSAMFINRKIKGIKGGGEKKYRFKKLIRVQLSFFFLYFILRGTNMLFHSRSVLEK